MGEYYTRTGKIDNRCKVCHREYRKAHYQENKPYYAEKARRNTKRYKKVARDYVWDLLSRSSCADCGKCDPRVMEFDHLRDKEHDVGSMISAGHSVETIKAEIEKCEIVCANCHKIRTSDRGGHWRSLRS